MCVGLLIEPSEHFELEIAFVPQGEDVFHGRLVIETNSRIVSVELIGTGREAMLSYDNSNIDFTKTIVGNVYRRQLVITNMGELIYPISVFIVRPHIHILSPFPSS